MRITTFPLLSSYWQIAFSVFWRQHVRVYQQNNRMVQEPVLERRNGTDPSGVAKLWKDDVRERYSGEWPLPAYIVLINAHLLCLEWSVQRRHDTNCWF